MFTMLPLKERASFTPSEVAVTGCVPCMMETSSHLPEVVYLTLPMPIDPGSLPNHSCIASFLTLGTRSRFL